MSQTNSQRGDRGSYGDIAALTYSTGRAIVAAMAADLLTNAVESIGVGLTDYKAGGDARLRSAVRNLYAGVLLIFKEKLRRLSPPGSEDVLLASKIVPTLTETGQLQFVRSGKKTVNVQEMKERFSNLGISVDWNALEQLSAIRNDIEHHYAKVEPQVIEEAIAKAFDVLDRFVRYELEEDPLTLLGRDSWKILLDAKDVFERERGECVERIRSVDWEFDILLEAMLGTKCEECGSSLIVPKGEERDAGIECRACENEQDFEGAAESALERLYAWQSNVAEHDGGEGPLAQCPTCNLSTYLWEENVCVLCSDTFERDCSRCGNEIPVSEFTSWGLCGYCDHVLSKDD